MRVGFISDTHFNMETGFKPLEELREKVDLILSGGDWGVIPFSVDEARTMKPRIVTVAGNHDDEERLRAYGILLEEGEVNAVDGLNICAVHSSLIPPYRPFLEFLGVLQRYAEMDVGHCDILITHEPPGYVYDRLENVVPGRKVPNVPGIRVFDQIVAVLKPKLVLCGHAHAKPYEYVEYPLSTGINETVNIPTLMVITTLGRTYAVIDYDETTKSVRRIEVFSEGENVFSVKPTYQYSVE